MITMTSEDERLRRKLISLLKADGYEYYADKLVHVPVVYTDEPGEVAYMNPDDGYIAINRKARPEQYVLLIKHELLHFILKHAEISMKKAAKNLGMELEDLEKLTPEELELVMSYVYQQYKVPMAKSSVTGSVTNIIGDWEISRYYTPEEISQALNIYLGDEISSGLVLSNDRPEWQGKTFEDMFDTMRYEIAQDIIKSTDESKIIDGALSKDRKSFVGDDGTVYDEAYFEGAV